jgi:hypothetical protein
VQIFYSWGGICLQWIIKNSHGNQIIEALADVTPVIVLERMLVLLNEMGKSKASALGVGGRAHKKCKILVWKYHFTREF